MNEEVSRLLANLQNVLTTVLWNSELFRCAIGEIEHAGYQIRFSVDAEVVGDPRATPPLIPKVDNAPRLDGTLELTSDDELFLRSLSIGT
jgi:hypothetical protein